MTASVARLAEDFDRDFAAAPAVAAEKSETFLAIRLGEDPYVVRASDIAGLVTDRRVVPLPSSEAALLGVASFRGRIVPVYDLAALIGYPLRPAGRWLLLAGQGEVALSITAFEAQLALSVDAFVSSTEGLTARPHVRGAVRVEGMVRPVADLSSVVKEIGRRVRTVQKTSKGE